jgi:hypothetical protein
MACLRFVGVLNAAVWLGAALFFSFVANEAFFGSDMEVLLGRSFPYFSGAIAHLLAKRYFAFQLVCAAIALAHLAAEWLYLGKYPQKSWLGLLVALALAVVAGGWWLEPKLQRLHDARYSLSARPAQRERASQSFRTWQTAARVVNLLSVAGLALYFWRMANPPDSTRFVRGVKFRS